MKKFLLIAMILMSGSAYAQSTEAELLSTLSSTVNVGNSADMGPASINIGNSPEMGQAAIINAEGNLALKSSIANINNQKAYGLYLNNTVLRASVYFEKRQINLYNVSLEAMQRKRIAYMKKSQNYSKEELDSLFDHRYKTGYIIP